MTDVTPNDIARTAQVSRLQDYTGTYTALGGGELNDTFALDCHERKVILRVSRHANTTTLRREAEALRLLNTKHVPKLLFFDESERIKNRPWVIESYIDGRPVSHLDTSQYKSLGQLLAQVHKITKPQPAKADLWKEFLYDCLSFGNEASLLNHSDIGLNQLIRKARGYLQNQSTKFGPVRESLNHGDVTLSNIRANGEEVSLIDWELSRFKDPMADFATIYYPDMEYNKGKWRVHIKESERSALFEGYRQEGGIINEQRLHAWMNLDKLGAVVYLYWKMYESGHKIEPKQLAQYKLDLDNLIKSLQKNLS